LSEISDSQSVYRHERAQDGQGLYGLGCTAQRHLKGPQALNQVQQGE